MFASNENFGNYTQAQFRNVILVGLVLFVLAIIIFRENIAKEFNWFEQNKEWRKLEYKMEFFGVVAKKGKDPRCHNHAYVQFTNSKKKIHDSGEYFWKKVSIGDSIAKKKNSKLLFIHKKDTVLIVDYDKVFKYRDSLMKAGKY